jgi:hypothetical protein
MFAATSAHRPLLNKFIFLIWVQCSMTDVEMPYQLLGSHLCQSMSLFWFVPAQCLYLRRLGSWLLCHLS